MTPQENELLCRVVGDAPMGQLMRRHWLPVCLTEEVAERDGTPITAKVLGEELVVFRDSSGRVGVLKEACPHRGASLVLGRNENDGLRCLYHGWKFDVNGTVLDMASEPDSKRMSANIKHTSFPVKEWQGLVWTYIGPSDSVPEFAPPAWAPNEEVKVTYAKVIIPCNWAQILEGAIDSAHSSSLHSSDMVPADVKIAGATDSMWLRPSSDTAPRMQVERTDYGFRYAAIRIPNYDADKNDYVRSTVFVAPSSALIPPNNLYNVANINVPVDDYTTAFYFIAWGHPDKTPNTESWRTFLKQTVGEDLDEKYRPLRTRENNFWQDRELMKSGNFTGITGFPNQDLAMWVSMGKIADRSADKLGTSDMAVAEFRKRMLKAVQDFMAGETPIGTGSKAISPEVCSFQAMIPKTQNWKEFKAVPVWEDNELPELEPSYSVPK